MSTLKERMEELAVDQPRGWQADLARHCGIKPPSVNGWLKGTSLTIEGDHLFKAAEFFGVVPAWLSSGALPKFPPDDSGRRPARSIGSERVAPSDQRSAARALMRVVAAFSNQDSAVRDAAATLAAEAIKRPADAESLARKLEALTGDLGKKAA